MSHANCTLLQVRFPIYLNAPVYLKWHDHKIMPLDRELWPCAMKHMLAGLFFAMALSVVWVFLLSRFGRAIVLQTVGTQVWPFPLGLLC